MPLLYMATKIIVRPTQKKRSTFYDKGALIISLHHIDLILALVALHQSTALL